MIKIALLAALPLTLPIAAPVDDFTLECTTDPSIFYPRNNNITKKETPQSFTITRSNGTWYWQMSDNESLVLDVTPLEDVARIYTTKTGSQNYRFWINMGYKFTYSIKIDGSSTIEQGRGSCKETSE